MTSTLSSSCNTAFKSVQKCFSGPIPDIGSTTTTPVCIQCGQLTESLFTSCNHNDLRDASVWSSAMKCHQEEGQICLKDINPKMTIDVVQCPNKCSQFIAKMSPIFNTNPDTMDDHDKSIQACASQYASVNSTTNSTTNGTTNGNSTTTTSSASAFFSFMVLSALILF
eukprot:NODE_143_length_15882_cov_1.296585.p9 type:complete len:168 gc:universal NODE_143_length_15882_cov_1.296585:9391-8888(-)